MSAATGVTPFRAIYGREAKLPSDSWIEDFSRFQGIDLLDYSEQLAQALSKVWDNIAVAKEKKDSHAEALLQRHVNLHDTYVGYLLGAIYLALPISCQG